MSQLRATITGQSEQLAAVLARSLDDAIATLEPARRIWLVGTGTSEHAAHLGAWMFDAGPRPVRAISSAGFAALSPDLRRDDAVIVISHTTKSAFARRARAVAREASAIALAITGAGRGWPEAIETVPPETSETYTASYTAALLVLARLAHALGRPGFGDADLSEIPGRVHAAAHEPATLDGDPGRLIVLAGVGPAAVTAREGALKLREGARALAEGFEAEYLLHGSAVPLGPGDVLLALEPPQDASGLLGGLVEAARGAGLRAQTVREPAGLDPVLAQIPLTVRLQGLAATLADERGEDPDRVIVGAWADSALWAAGDPG